MNSMNKKFKLHADPYGLLSEPTTEEIKEWEQSPHLSDNPYTLFGWLINKRKNEILKTIK